jgi:hypothetical protein
MPLERFELRVLNPRGETEKNPVMPASPRLKGLKGKRIGIIRIRIQAGEILFPYLEKALREQAPDTMWEILDIPLSENGDERARGSGRRFRNMTALLFPWQYQGQHNKAHTRCGVY